MLRIVLEVTAASVLVGGCQRPSQTVPRNGYMVLLDSAAKYTGRSSGDTLREIARRDVPTQVVMRATAEVRRAHRGLRCVRYFRADTLFGILALEQCSNESSVVFDGGGLGFVWASGRPAMPFLVPLLNDFVDVVPFMWTR